MGAAKNNPSPLLWEIRTESTAGRRDREAQTDGTEGAQAGEGGSRVTPESRAHGSSKDSHIPTVCLLKPTGTDR